MTAQEMMAEATQAQDDGDIDRYKAFEMVLFVMGVLPVLDEDDGFVRGWVDSERVRYSAWGSRYRDSG